MSQNVDKTMAYIMNESGDDFSKVAVCTSRPVAINEHPSTSGHLTGLGNKPQRKQTSQFLAVVLW